MTEKVRRLLIAVMVAMAGAGCAARSEAPESPGVAATARPPVQQFRSCREMWRAGWTEGVRADGRGSYSPGWKDAQKRTYALNSHLDRNRWEACHRWGLLPLSIYPTTPRAGAPAQPRAPRYRPEGDRGGS